MKNGYTTKKYFILDEIYKQHFWVVLCREQELNKILAKILNTSIDKCYIDVSGYKGYRFNMENIDTKQEIEFIWIDSGDKNNINILYHELLHHTFNVFTQICPEQKYVVKDSEEPFCYYYDYIRIKTLSKIFKKLNK